MNSGFQKSYGCEVVPPKLCQLLAKVADFRQDFLDPHLKNLSRALRDHHRFSIESWSKAKANIDSYDDAAQFDFDCLTELNNRSIDLRSTRRLMEDDDGRIVYYFFHIFSLDMSELRWASVEIEVSRDYVKSIIAPEIGN